MGSCNVAFKNVDQGVLVLGKRVLILGRDHLRGKFNSEFFVWAHRHGGLVNLSRYSFVSVVEGIIHTEL